MVDLDEGEHAVVEAEVECEVEPGDDEIPQRGEGRDDAEATSDEQPTFISYQFSLGTLRARYSGDC